MSTLHQDRVFVALTRPQMFLGVTYSFFIVNLVITSELFLIFKALWIVISALVIHAIGYVACVREPRFLELWLVKLARCPRVADYRRWGCNSYAP